MLTPALAGFAACRWSLGKRR